jgi:hypothetical protein
MKEDTVAGHCNNQKKLVGVTVQDMIQGAGGNGVEVPQAPSFPPIYSPPRSCLSCLHASCGRNRETGQLCRVEESNPDGWLLLEDDSLLMAAMVAEGCTVVEGRADKFTDTTNLRCWWLCKDQSLSAWVAVACTSPRTIQSSLGRH